MKLKTIYILFFCAATYSCNHAQTMSHYNHENYKNLRSDFDSSFIDQFPKTLERINQQENFIISNTDTLKNKIGLFLYEYNIDKKNLDSIENFISKKKSFRRYNSSDTCLLIVNRYETKYTAEEDIIPPVSDSSLIEKNCYNTMLPIPNFIDYKGSNSTNCNLDSTFVIYVLEARPGIYFKKYQSKPFVHMPIKWSNGFSKGVAISRMKNIIIYWSIIW